MYHHLLVPLDGTELSIELVGNAVGLAKTLGARITFFHAVPDHAGALGGDAEIVRATSGADYAYAFVGRAREVLAKAEAAARACGVPCSSAHAVSDKPSAAIIAAARDAGCDLIFMASHGARSKIGMALASETLTVLMHAGLPVLVSATGEPQAPAHAIAVIRDEHRSLAAVLHAWMHALGTAHAAGVPADAGLMQSIMDFIQTFPTALHHPKEDEYLFRSLRARSSAYDAELDELERQHERDRQLVRELAQHTERLVSVADATARLAASRTLEEAVRRYAAFVWEHLGREEGVILPAAQRHLTAQDWAQIDAAFSQNRDPRFGGDADKAYRQIFSRIVNLTA